MYISFSKYRSKNFLIISINATSDYYFSQLIENYQSKNISFVIISAKKLEISGHYSFYIPVSFLVAILSWILLFRKNETKRIKLELNIYYIILCLINMVLSFRSVFLYGDRHGFAEPAALKLCETHDIDSYVIAVARSSGVNEFFNKLDRLPKDKFNAHIIKNDTDVRFEHQICDINTRQTFSYYPRTYYNALEGFWKSSDHPWINGGGASKGIIVDREVEAIRLQFYGCNTEKIIRSTRLIQGTGQISKSSPQQKFELKNVLGVVAPVYYEHGLCNYETTKDILKTIMQIGEKSFDRVFVSLHPKMDIKNYSFLNSGVCEVFHSNIEKLISVSSKICIPAGSSIYADALEAGIFSCVFNPLKLRFDVNYEQYRQYGLRYCETMDEMLVILSEANAIQKADKGIKISSDRNMFKKIIER